ncbi:nicotinate-nucleotide adenylyltransferase [Azonexus sp.]|jgi:nicotinate-nucleotide adenylyltransferase|uniref:nicotinate-nucleotide adenylyltransferase n=1 Tax=Azonexus sp. TaxID=1872668 RepID=UPI0035D4E5DA
MPVTGTFSVFLKLSERSLGPLGLFGGTFDPVHFGHLRLAEEAIDQLALEDVRWIPAGQPAHRGPPRVSAGQRLAMVRLAVAGNPGFSVDAAEVEATVPSYTVPTLERLRAELGVDRPLVLLLGADALAGLESWYRWRELFALTHIAVSHRPGFPVAATALPPALAEEFAARQRDDAAALRVASAGSIVAFEMTQLAISATQIRQLQAAGRSARYLLPDKVLDYIQTHSLYRNS